MAASPVSGRLGVVADAFRSQIWPLPVLGIVLAVTLGVAIPEFDANVDPSLPDLWSRYTFGGGPDAARSVLGAVAGSLITITSLTFSLTVLTLQLASGQFSPRLLRTFSSDRYVHVTLALFVATFVYALTVLRSVRTSDEDSAAFVPRIAVTVALLLTLASVLALVLFLAHLAGEIRVDTMLRRVHVDTETSARRVLTERDGPVHLLDLPTPPADAFPLLAPGSGFLTAVDEPSLFDGAQATGTVLLLERPPGSSVVAGTPVGWAWALDGGDTSQECREQLRKAVSSGLSIGHERTAAQDVAFGLTQITDVASKALSPGINDPRTAIHALSHSSDLLCTLAGYALGPVVLRDDQDRPRLHRALPDLADLLDLAVSAPRRYGAADPDLLSRLYALLAEVAWSSDAPEHRAAVRHQLGRLERTASQQDFDEAEQGRLAELGEQVRAALEGRHRSPARAVVA